MSAVLLVHVPGPLATVQDLGREGVGHYGVPMGGAFDRAAHRLGNALVGNPPGAAAIEITLGPFVAEVLVDVVVAATGTSTALVVDGREVGTHRAVAVAAGARLEVAAPWEGVRTTLAVRGGIDTPVVLGSRSTDARAGIGAPPLSPGTRLAVGTDVVAPPAADPAPPMLRPRHAVLRVLPGPRLDRLPRGLAALGRVAWKVSSRLDRTGIVFDGPSLGVDEATIPSEGMPPGAVQVPPGGRPIMLGPDAGRTGGYPVVAVVVDEDRDLAAQLRPGDSATFSPVVGW